MTLASGPRNDAPEQLAEFGGGYPRLAITGPMLGRNHGFVTTQGEFLTDLFREAGYDVISTSTRPGRTTRVLDIASTLRRSRPRIDLTIVETYSGLSFIVEDVASAIAHAGGRPVVFHVHGGAMPSFARRFPRWTRRVFRRAAAVVAPSGYLARELSPLVGAVRVIPNVIELDGYPYRRRDRVAPRLFWMRAYHPIYNPVMAVRVLAKVRVVLPDATLVMAGQEKGMMTDVTAAAREFGVTDSVEILGFLDERRKREIAERCDIFINTTHVDNAPVGVVEMCAMGLPVVSTGVGGVPDLLTHEETGLLTPDGDVDAMADAIIRLVREPALAARLSRNGAAVAARSGSSGVVAQWEALFAELLR